jgi:hypothetical protein
MTKFVLQRMSGKGDECSVVTLMRLRRRCLVWI